MRDIPKAVAEIRGFAPTAQVITQSNHSVLLGVPGSPLRVHLSSNEDNTRVVMDLYDYESETTMRLFRCVVQRFDAWSDPSLKVRVNRETLTPARNLFHDAAYWCLQGRRPVRPQWEPEASQ